MQKMPTILIIESNRIYRRTLRDIIRNRFPELRIAEACDAEEGLEKAIDERPQLIVTGLHLDGDISLPMIHQITQRRLNTPIAVLSDMDEDEYRKAAIAQGADYFITKGGPDGQQVLKIIKKKIFNA